MFKIEFSDQWFANILIFVTVITLPLMFYIYSIIKKMLHYHGKKKMIKNYVKIFQENEDSIKNIVMPIFNLIERMEQHYYNNNSVDVYGKVIKNVLEPIMNFFKPNDKCCCNDYNIPEYNYCTCRMPQPECVNCNMGQMKTPCCMFDKTPNCKTFGCTFDKTPNCKTFGCMFDKTPKSCENNDTTDEILKKCVRKLDKTISSEKQGTSEEFNLDNSSCVDSKKEEGLEKILESGVNINHLHDLCVIANEYDHFKNMINFDKLTQHHAIYMFNTIIRMLEINEIDICNNIKNITSKFQIPNQMITNLLRLFVFIVSDSETFKKLREQYMKNVTTEFKENCPNDVTDMKISNE